MGPSFGPLGLGGGAGCLRPVETTKGRLETLLAERSLTDMINGSAGMRVAYLNPPTFGSGVLDHLETGGGFLPPTPLHSGRFVGHPPKINPFEPNGPSLDPFGLNGS